MEPTQQRNSFSAGKNENVFGFVNNENRIDVNVSMKDDDGCPRTKRKKWLHVIWPKVIWPIVTDNTLANTSLVNTQLAETHQLTYSQLANSAGRGKHALVTCTDTLS